MSTCSCGEPAVDTVVVPLCKEHKKLMVLAMVPEVFKTYPPSRWQQAHDEYEAAFGPIKALPQPYRGDVRVRPAKHLQGHASVVYFIQVGDRVKIGTTTNLKQRLMGLALPSDAKLLKTIPGSQATEHRHHSRFAAQRIGTSEWFRLEGKLAAYLNDAAA